ncbi:MAG: biotin--[acetyl-CoA-carboxylase] ligase [Desulfuromonadales bacterium]|nr:biotin--[acetyl-CoA-carboxylase] ligase [Desulfuromonadales bacterium]
MGNGAREEILRLFRRGGDLVSGEELSRILGISRTAVWKQIRLLREQGYVIEAVPSRGYRLTSTPDLLLPAEIRAGLDTQIIGREIVYLAEADSTNLRASLLGEAGSVEGTVVIADQQSAGKGRLGRRWSSPPGVNLYTSVLLRPPISPRSAPQLTFLSAVATAWAIEETSGLEPQVKWPNDILLGGKKVAGLLNEMSAETDRVHFVVLGIGVNLNMQAGQFPQDLRYPATSLTLETGRPISRLRFARSLLHHLEGLYRVYLEKGFTPILLAWKNLFDLAGRQVEVDLQKRRLSGVAIGIDEDGALLVRLVDGSTERVLAGDVTPADS